MIGVLATNGENHNLVLSREIIEFGPPLDSVFRLGSEGDFYLSFDRPWQAWSFWRPPAKALTC